MPVISRLSTKTLVSQFNKRDYPENKGVGNSDSKNPIAIVGLVVAALTLFVGIVSLRRSRFRRWVSHLLPSRFVKKDHGIALQSPVPTAIQPTENSSAIPTAEVPMPSPVFIYNDYSNTYISGAHPDPFPYCHYEIAGEDGTVPQVEESLRPRRLKPAVGTQFP